MSELGPPHAPRPATKRTSPRRHVSAAYDMPGLACTIARREPASNHAPILFPNREGIEVGQDRMHVLVGKVDCGISLCLETFPSESSACNSRGLNRP